MKIIHTEDYATRRAAEYPPLGDQLDELWKLLDGLKVKSPLLEQIKAVKAKYPKPAQ